MAGDHEFNQVFFDNVQVPRNQLVGEEDRGWYVAVTLLDFERSGIDYAASASRLLDDLTTYVVNSHAHLYRQEYNSWVKEALAERYTEVEVARLIAYKVAWMQSQGMVPNREASVSKVFGTETTQRNAKGMLEILGMYGQLAEGSQYTPLQGRILRAWYSAISATIAAGTSEIQRNVIAQRGLLLPRG